MKTGQQYIDSLRDRKMEVYYLGERIGDPVEHLAFRPHIQAAAATYDMAFHPDWEDLGSAVSCLTGERINRFTHIHQSAGDLVKKVKALRALGCYTGTCFQRCVGWDALNALYITTYDMDQKKGTSYHSRLLEFLRYVQREDLMCDGAMTDPKGDRSLPPHKQVDPDLYLRIVERRADGIVVRGAKAHQTGAVNSHEVIAMPTTAMGPNDADWSVSFAIPADAPGVTHIFGRQTNDTRRLENTADCGNYRFGIVGGEALIVFDDVFVPWERVFMCGEHEFAGQLVETFASFHRQNYGGCKAGVADVMVGAAAVTAEYQGTASASHVRDKLTEMMQMAETLYCGSIACSAEGTQTPSGAYFVNPLLANSTKLNVTRFMYEISRLAQDIAGGFIATLPSEKDLRHPTVGKYVKKYFAGVAGIPVEDRFRMARLLENMSCGAAMVEAMHGAGSPQAQKIMIYRQGNLESKKKAAKRLAGIDDESKDTPQVR